MKLKVLVHRIVGLVAFLGMCVACAESSVDSPGFGEPVALDIGLEVGRLDGPPEEAFGDITGLTQDAEGRMYVSDRQADAIRVFDSTGTFLYSVGRSGKGPGELSGPCCIAIGPDGVLWVRESGNARYSWFSPGQDEAAYVGGLPLAHGDANRSTPIHFVGDSLFLDVGFAGRSSTGAPLLQRFWRSRSGETLRSETLPSADSKDLGMESVSFSSGGRDVTRFFYPRYGPNDLLAHGPEGVVVHGLSSAYMIEVWTADDTLQVDGGRSEGPRLSSREDSIQGEAIRRMEKMAGRSLSLPRATRKQPVANTFFDVVGRLWVEVSTAEGMRRVFEVWSADGSPLSSVSIARDIQVNPPFGWVGRDQLLGIRRDNLGVSYVVRITHGVPVQ